MTKSPLGRRASDRSVREESCIRVVKNPRVSAGNMRVPSPDPQGEGHERCVDQQETGFAPAPAPHFFGARFWLLRCRALGISVQPARPYTPTDKAIVERTFHSINTLFCQHVAGYVGGNVTMRGKDPARTRCSPSRSCRTCSTNGWSRCGRTGRMNR